MDSGRLRQREYSPFCTGAFHTDRTFTSSRPGSVVFVARDMTGDKLPEVCSYDPHILQGACYRSNDDYQSVVTGTNRTWGSSDQSIVL